MKYQKFLCAGPQSFLAPGPLDKSYATALRAPSGTLDCVVKNWEEIEKTQLPW